MVLYVPGAPCSCMVQLHGAFGCSLETSSTLSLEIGPTLLLMIQLLHHLTYVYMYFTTKSPILLVYDVMY